MTTRYKSIQSSTSQGQESNVQEDLSSESDNNNNNNLLPAQYEYKRWCGIRRSSVLLCLYIFSYIGYLIGGGYIMALLETPYEKGLRLHTNKLKVDFLKSHPSVNKTELEILLEFVMQSSKQGISVLDAHLEEDNWSFGQSLLFTVTVVTTIGYGHIVPLTQVGKLFCIIYAILGIPFTLVFLSASVQRLLGPTVKFLTLLLSSRLGERVSPFGVRLIHLVVLCMIFGIGFVLLPTLIFSSIEPRWTFLDAFYYVFISLTTIGLGDFIPGDSDEQALRDVYKTSVAVYLLLGLIFMTLTLTVFYDIPQLNLGLHLHQHMDIHLPQSVVAPSSDSSDPNNRNIHSDDEKHGEKEAKGGKMTSSFLHFGRNTTPQDQDQDEAKAILEDVQ